MSTKMYVNDSTFGRIRGFPGEGRQMTLGLSRTAILAVSLTISSKTFKMRPALLYGDTQSVVGFQ